MNILGISCFCHDSAACLLQNGKIVAAAEEERFTRKKSTSEFPLRAINYCLQEADVSIYDIDYIGFYEKSFLKFYRVIASHLASWPFSLKNFVSTFPFWLEDRLIMPLVLKRELGFEGNVLFIKHHQSHASSAFLVSGFKEAAILTSDAVGEWATTCWGYGKENEVRIMQEIHFPDSLGLLYTAVTTYLGFEALKGEGKVMGLAAYGKPRFIDTFMKIMTVKDDGSFRLNQRFFGFLNERNRMYNARFIKLFGQEREPGSDIQQRHCDIAASIQKITEDILISIARHLYKETGLDKLCLAGGLFLNCVANHKLLEHTPFKELFIQPAAGNAGGAIGVAAYIHRALLKNQGSCLMESAYLGPGFSESQMKRAILQSGLQFEEFDETGLCEFIAQKLAQDYIVGWFQGRMEFGPRGLGNRSILANPCNPKMKDLLNSKVKEREPFRPYASAVLEERAEEYFTLRNKSPFMLLASQVKEDKRKVIPAVTHADSTARVQTVNKHANALFWKLIQEFGKITGVPMIINTSFNVRDEPIVCTPQDALRCLKRGSLDFLAMGSYVVKNEKTSR